MTPKIPVLQIDKMKRLLSLILFLTILVQLFTIPVFAAKTVIKGETELEFIKALNIVGNWDPSEIVTRAEFVDAAVRCIVKDSSSVVAPNTVFNDVPADHWAAYNIDVAVKSGIISGAGTGSFEPEGYLTYAAAMKIAVNALGYGAVAEQNGGFPTGYFIAASTVGIDVPNVENTNILTKGEAAIILKNILETVPMGRAYIFGDEEYFMPENEDRTILNRIHSIRSFKGIVTSNPYTSIDSTSIVPENTVRIESLTTGRSEIFNIGETKAADYIGRHMIVYYYESDESPYTLFKLMPDPGEVVVSIEGDDIVEASYNNRKIKYSDTNEINRWNESESNGSVIIPIDASIIHNGIFTGDVKGIFDIINGNTENNVESITLYDNNRDGSFEFVDVKTYYTLNVDYVYDGDDRLVLTDNVTGKTIQIDKYNNKIMERRYTSDGIELPGYGVIEGNTVGVSYAKGEVELYNLYVSKDSKVDTFKAVNEDEIQSVDYTYYLSNTLKKYFKDKEMNVAKQIESGVEYTLFFDHKGKLAGYYSQETGYDTYYGIIQNKDDYIYILDAQPLNSRLGTSTIQFKVSTLEAEVSVMTSTSKLKVNNMTVTSGSKGISPAEAIAMVKGKLVQYTKDSMGYIKTITLPEDSTEDNVFSYTFGLDQSAGPVKLRYRGGPKVFYYDNVGSAAIDSKTTILWVPSQRLVEEGVDVNLYCKRGALNNFATDQSYYINSYKVNNSSVTANIIVAYNDGEPRIDSFTKPIVVRKVEQSYNKSGHVATKIYGNQDTKDVEIASEESVFKKHDGTSLEVGVGDLVRLALNAMGDCSYAEVLFDYSDYETVDKSYSSAYRAIRGSVYQHDTNTMYMVKNKWDINDADIIPANIESQICSSSAKIYLLDVKAEKLTKVTSGSLVDYKFDNINYSRVVVANSYGTPDLIVIYK